jgi:hypothetical protein
MITQNPNGSLTYKDVKGNSVTVGIFDQDFSRVEGILGQQIAADNANRAALAMYAAELASSQKQIDLGVPMADIPIPMQITVDDQGNTSKAPFTGLPVLTTTGGGGIRATTGLPPDEQHLTYLMVCAMFRKEFPDA